MKPATRPAIVTVGDEDTRYPCVVQIGRRWNGFVIPGFTHGQVQPVVNDTNRDAEGSPEAPHLYFLPNGRLVQWEPAHGPGDEPSVEDVGPDENGLYWPGAYSWTWTEVAIASTQVEFTGVRPILASLEHLAHWTEDSRWLEALTFGRRQGRA